MRANKPVKILVVDDDQDILRLASTALTQANFNVSTATSTLEASRAMENTLPDLILLDVMLPDVGGREFAKELKKDPRTAKIPIIMMSAVAKSLHEQVLGLAHGAEDYVIKPFKIPGLISKINELLRTRR